jgi:MFS family permease
VLALCLGSLTYGYAFSIISTTLGQPNWYAYFDLTTDPTEAAKYAYTNRITGACSGLFSVGGMIGALLLGWMSDARGRKMSLVVATVISLVGGALQAGSVHIAMFLVARFVTGVGVGMQCTPWIMMA